MYLFFDTETTGVPLNYKAKMSDLDNWPRVIQLAFVLYNEDRKLIDSYCQLIRPDGWMIPLADFWANNGFFQDTQMQKGIPIANALDKFLEAVKPSKYLIAHNINFDYNILGAEMIRANKKSETKLTRLCTMAAGTDFCKLPNSRNDYGGYKWPKLAELHELLFHQHFQGAHDALNDVKATARCFFEMVDRKIITL